MSARLGNETERRVRDRMIAAGWQFVMHAAGSKGSADLLMGHIAYGGALVQVGRKSKTLGPADRERLCSDAELIGALALLAIYEPRKPLLFWSVTRETPGRWPSFDITGAAA